MGVSARHEVVRAFIEVVTQDCSWLVSIGKVRMPSACAAIVTGLIITLCAVPLTLRVKAIVAC
jgi:hypothetical protein